MRKIQRKIEVKCNSCETLIDLSPVTIKLTNIKIGEEELLMQYFLCPNCECFYKVCLFTYALFLNRQKDKLKELNAKYNGRFTYDKDTKRIYYHENDMDKRKEE